MKVKELIQQLQGFDHDMEVMVDGYEGGITPPKAPTEIEICLDVHNCPYMGKHQLAEDCYCPYDEEPHKKTKVVYLER